MAASREAELAAYHRASTALLGLIHGDRAESRTVSARRRRAEAKMSRARALLAALGNPDRAYPIVHVTGTSGKGSTCAAIAAILTAAGYRVGLRTSPYLQVPTEKIQVDNALIDALSFDRITGQVLREANRLDPSTAPGRRFGYAEAWSALAFSWFAEREVDIAVIEVGAGGRFDTTNIIEPAVSVITSVGLDHVKSLGPSLSDIAWHKAGIIKPGAPVVIGQLPAEALRVISAAAGAAAVELVQAADSDEERRWSLGMTGAFQHQNARLAVAAVEVLGGRGFPVAAPAIARGLQIARMPGRLERMSGNGRSPVWIDGAHNADKIAAVAREVAALWDEGPLPVVVLGMLGAKDATAISAHLATLASATVVTQPAALGKRPMPATALASAVTASGYAGELFVEPDPDAALDCAEALATARDAEVLVTGSLYLAGQLRRRWHADEEIVLQRTPWPRRAKA